MRDFSYSTHEQQNEIEYILKKRKQKLAKQQVVFFLILIAIFGSIVYYFLHKSLFTELDGYVKVDAKVSRPLTDIFIVDISVKIGQTVYPGDTLYSFLHTAQFVERTNLNKEIPIVQEKRQMELMLQKALREKELLVVIIKELKKQISIEEHDIRFGLSDNSSKMNLERELAENEERLAGEEDNIRTIGRYLSDINSFQKQSAIKGIEQTGFIRKVGKELLKPLLHYAVVEDTAVVTNIAVPNRTYVLRGEEILHTQSLNLRANNLYVKIYVPMDEVDKCKPNTPVTIIVNDDVRFHGHINSQGTRAEELPPYLRSNFHREAFVNISVAVIDPDQMIPFWALSNNIPVKVRINNLELIDHKNDIRYFRT